MRIRCARCCLCNSVKVVNLIILLFGMVIIVYSLWLEHQWDRRIFLLPVSSSPKPNPWFIFACLGIGIAVSLSTLSGYAVANYIANYTLGAYIFFTCCLLLLEAALVIIVFFKMNWISKFIASVGDVEEEFVQFVIFHVEMTRLIVLLILAAQMSAVGLAAVFWGRGMEHGTRCHERNVSTFTQSFLVPIVEPDSTIPLQSYNITTTTTTTRNRISQGNNFRRSYFSWITDLIRSRFQSNGILH